MVLNWSEIESVLGCGAHVLMFGPPGTGKTRSATTGSSYSITLTAETPAAELRGHFVPKGSEFVWMDGPAMSAWRTGQRLVLNEIDQASGDALTFLYAVLDDCEVARLTLPSGETVRPSAGFQCIATMNGDPLSLPEALLDRFAIRIHVDEAHPKALQRLPQTLAAAVEHTRGKGADHQVSLRQALTYQRLQGTLNPDIAARAIFGPRAEDISNSIKLAAAAIAE